MCPSNRQEATCPALTSAAATSTYVPTWVKLDPARFPRSKIKMKDDLVTVDALSVFGRATRTADAKAFRMLMKHLKEVDEAHSTVIMVQVENEVGILGDSRDRSDLAEQFWQQSVPAPLLDMLAARNETSVQSGLGSGHHSRTTKIDGTTPTWADLHDHGDQTQTDELFMAYHFAEFVETVAAAGKAVFPLPLYTNVWQNYAGDDRDTGVVVPEAVSGGSRPGDYPSGGGVPGVLDVWKRFAPSLDLIAPDIYLTDYTATCKAYCYQGQALLIPEQRRDEYGARRIWTAYGSYNCIGTAPFGIDTVSADENPYRRHYGLLSGVAGYLIEASTGEGETRCHGFHFDDLRDDGTDPTPPFSCTLGGWHLTIERAHVFGKPSAGAGLVIQTSSNIFLLVGWGFQVGFRRLGDSTFTGILRFEEKEIVPGTGALRTLRLLNGDETRNGKFAVMPSEDPDYGDFPISITIPARTGIAMVEPYAF